MINRQTVTILNLYLQANDEIKQEIVQVATQMAGRFVENSMDEKTQAALVDETLKEMGDATWQS